MKYILLFLGVSVKWKNGAFGSCGGDNNREEKNLSYRCCVPQNYVVNHFQTGAEITSLMKINESIHFCSCHYQGFMAELGASGSFCPAHVTLPVKAYFFSLSDDNAPSPYLVRFCLCYVMLCFVPDDSLFY